MATPDDQLATMIANLPEKTGKDLEGWKKVIAASGLEKHGEIVKMLKTEHGMTHGFANLVTHEFRGGVVSAPADGDDLIAAQYAGPKADLTNIRDALFAMVTGFGKDVEIAPKKTYASIRRKTQFALVQPSTKTRVDVGIKLKDHPAAGRLEDSGSFNSMVTHRVRVESVEAVDAELEGWLRAAYDQAG